MKRIRLLIFLAILFPLCLLAQNKTNITGKVIGIKDGDTIEVLLEGNRSKIIRLAEVDCPESGQAYGKNAKQYTSTQVFGKNVQFIITSTDRWGRSIAKVYYDNKYLSEEIIKSGMGWHYHQYSNNKKLAQLQQKAKLNKKGLWKDLNAQSPWDFRKSKKKKTGDSR